MKRTQRRAFERANKRNRIIIIILSVVTCSVLALIFLVGFKTQQVNREKLAEKTTEQISKKKTSFESERSSTKRIDESLDTAESRAPAQATQVDVPNQSETIQPESSQVENTEIQEYNEHEEHAMGRAGAYEGRGPENKPIDYPDPHEHIYIDILSETEYGRIYTCSICGKWLRTVKNEDGTETRVMEGDVP